jgi:hypothetical protein
MVDDVVAWRLVKIRPASSWRAMGPYYWERKGDVPLSGDAKSDRELLTAALTAVLNRLGER